MRCNKLLHAQHPVASDDPLCDFSTKHLYLKIHLDDEGGSFQMQLGMVYETVKSLSNISLLMYNAEIMSRK